MRDRNRKCSGVIYASSRGDSAPRGRTNAVLIIFLLISFCNLDLLYSAGTTSANFLNIGPNPRAVAMGGAFTSISDDISAMYYNIGGLAQQNSREITLTHNIWIENITYDYIAYAFPVGENIRFGNNITYLSTGRIKGYDVDGNETGEFNNYDLSSSIGSSFKLTCPITNMPMYIGLNVKYVYEKLENETSQAIAVDIGDIHRFGDLSFGVVVQNLGSKIKFVSESFSLPMNIKTGVSYRLFDDSLLVGVDGNFKTGEKTTIATGGEYKLNIGDFIFAFRGGYNTRISKEIGNNAGISAGFGIGFQGLIVDYAWLPYGDLGQSHQISLSCKF